MPKNTSYLAKAWNSVAKGIEAMAKPYQSYTRSKPRGVSGKTIWPGNKGSHGSSKLGNRSVKRGGSRNRSRSKSPKRGTLRASAPSWEPPFPKLKAPAGSNTIWAASNNYNPMSVHGSAALRNPNIKRGGATRRRHH